MTSRLWRCCFRVNGRNLIRNPTRWSNTRPRRNTWQPSCNPVQRERPPKRRLPKRNQSNHLTSPTLLNFIELHQTSLNFAELHKTWQTPPNCAKLHLNPTETDMCLAGCFRKNNTETTLPDSIRSSCPELTEHAPEYVAFSL